MPNPTPARPSTPSVAIRRRDQSGQSEGGVNREPLGSLLSGVAAGGSSPLGESGGIGGIGVVGAAGSACGVEGSAGVDSLVSAGSAAGASAAEGALARRQRKVGRGSLAIGGS